MIKVILFDLGGVVFRDIYSGGSKDFAAALGLPEQRVLDAYRATDVPEWPEGKISDEQRMTLMVDELKLPRNCAQQFVDAFNLVFAPIPETVKLLEDLHYRGRFRLGVLSDQHSSADSYLRRTYGNVMQLFDPTLAFISCEVGLAKHELDLGFFRYAISHARVRAAEILLVDDSSANIERANRIGMSTHFFDRKTYSAHELVSGLQKLLA